jgi:alpha-tubulin suppressor-like RCC1 family protein
VLAAALCAALLLPSGAVGEQASSRAHRVASGLLDVGARDTCAVLDTGRERCWGNGSQGQPGYGNTDTIGDDETPDAAGPVDLGTGRTVSAIGSGYNHTCAILDNAQVRCWGSGAHGHLGYGNTDNVGDDETPGSVGPVNLGPGRTAVEITGGAGHVCAILDNGRVRCWGSNSSGQLGYPNTGDIGDDETPGSVGPVNLGAGRTAIAITGGGDHTCAILDNGKVRCWGTNSDGQLGYPNMGNVGDDETPGSIGPVNLGAGRTAVAITGGNDHTCAILDNGRVRCWGDNFSGQLGYPNTGDIGDDETPGSVGPVDLGAGRTAVAISAGDDHTCAALDNGTVRCWGSNSDGQLGYGNFDNIGDDESPAAAGPVNLGAGRTAVAIAAGALHTCALLDHGAVRCWGDGNDGQLGYGDTDTIGDDETPDTVGPVSLGGTIATRGISELSLKAKPKRDRTKPFKFTAKGRLTGSWIADTATCQGRVKVKAKKGSRTVARDTSHLRLAAGECTYKARLKTRKRGRLKLSANFAGTTNLTPDKSNAVKVRAG